MTPVIKLPLRETTGAAPSERTAGPSLAAIFHSGMLVLSGERFSYPLPTFSGHSRWSIVNDKCKDSRP